MYGAVDPIYMVMFMKLLGPEYQVWDKSAAIQYKKPGRSELHAVFTVSDEELSSVRDALASREKIDRTYQVTLFDENDKVTAIIDKTLHFRKKGNVGTA